MGDPEARPPRLGVVVDRLSSLREPAAGLFPLFALNGDKGAPGCGSRICHQNRLRECNPGIFDPADHQARDAGQRIDVGITGDCRTHIDGGGQNAQRLGGQFIGQKETRKSDPRWRILCGCAALQPGIVLPEITSAKPGCDIHEGRRRARTGRNQRNSTIGRR